ncbi:hypothetical protein ALI144C_22645 [Actinosynnema sp. ALI-1.44]|uniref:hypothetical protein n=1 Tax=Actinosynnema sp. ALI-1.44 TaxID=1933779 RepID=UPI00097BD9BD|nr:hypothetical protein [Actinosynnema sp. ALI-1.44]ONI81316.1 hypothetical protein ALI144C_22645 [Actinosynnema sp. ALI-1.44]
MSSAVARFLNWLTDQGVTSLGEVSTDHCEAYLAYRRYLLDENNHVVGKRSPATRRAAAQTVVDLITQVRHADRKWSHTHEDHVFTSTLPADEITRLLAPLTRVSLGLLARQAGFTQFWRQWIPHLRDQIEATLNVVGGEKPFARNASVVDRADEDGTLTWTLPLDRLEAIAVVGIVRTAAIILAQLAAQHDEIARLRRRGETSSNVHKLQVRTASSEPCS